MKKLIVAAIMVFAVAALLMVTATPSEAVHAASGELTCGQCHTMHSSQGDDQGSGDMGTATGSSLLLRIGGTKKVSDLCLSCHAEDGDGADIQFNSGGWLTTPPKVLLLGGSWDSDFTLIGAGGDFASVISNPGTGVYASQNNDSDATGDASLGYGHSINNTNALAPPGATGAETITDFACTECHDPHGVTATTVDINLYRNLKSGLGDDNVVWAAGAGGDLATSYVGGVFGDATGGRDIAAADNIWPVINAALTDENSYLTGTANSNMSRFCAQCHGNWHEAIETNNGSEVGQVDWRRHPVDAALVDVTGTIDLLSAAGATIVDFGHYSDTYGGLAVGYKLPAMESTSTGDNYYGNEDTDKVFCLSCHFAHAGPNFDALRWSYQTTVTTGSQVGISLESTVGCQQCHNRGGTFGD